jgi:hypothetical protein
LSGWRPFLNESVSLALGLAVHGFLVHLGEAFDKGLQLLVIVPAVTQ